MINNTPFEWGSNHLHLVGWPMFIGLVWKTRGAIEKFVNKWETIDTRTQATVTTLGEVKAATEAITGNHLKHMEEDMTRQTTLLESIDKNIAILVDRSPR